MKLLVIVGTTRPGRVTDRIAKWVASSANEMTDVNAEVVDLADYPMPFLNEAISPQYNPQRKPEGDIKRWLEKLSEGDAFVVVTPEYNRSIPGVLKNALDYVAFEFAKKPVAFVGHGSVGGAYSITDLRLAFPQLLAITVPKATHIAARAGELMNESGVLNEELKDGPQSPLPQLKMMLE